MAQSQALQSQEKKELVSKDEKDGAGALFRADDRHLRDRGRTDRGHGGAGGRSRKRLTSALKTTC